MVKYSKLKKMKIKHLGLQPYNRILSKMQSFTQKRTTESNDEIWILQHPKIFTMGKTSKKYNIITLSDIPIIQSDRGGEITFHGPGQLIVYFMLDLRRMQLSVRKFIHVLEQIVITTLLNFNIYSNTINSAPGVYINNKKICSIGLKIYKNYSLHGFSLNIKMDLTPFKYINPCGYKNLKMTQMSNLIPEITINDVIPIVESTCKFFFKY